MNGDRPIPGTFLRFLLVGGSFAVLYALTTAFLVGRLPLPKPATSALVWLACIPPAYWCQRRFAFRAETTRRGAIWIYGLAQLISLVIVSAAGALFVSGSDMIRDTIVYLIASAVAAVSSYAINRMVTFKT